MRAIHAPVEPLLSGLGSTRRALSSLLRIHHHNRPPNRRLRHRPRLAITSPLSRRWLSSDAALDQDPRYERFRNAVWALLTALRQNDTVKLYFCLMDLTHGVTYNNQAFAAAVSRIPITTFSEIIRAFDPFTISRELDSTSGLRISNGAAIYTPLGDLTNKWGVKVVYVQILNRLILVSRARRREAAQFNNGASLHLLPHDYRILMRCAAATSDIMLAKAFYRQMKPQGYIGWVNSEMYTDLVKAAYLTESLYTRHDLAAVRVRPLDMHLDLPARVIRRLRGIEVAFASRPGYRADQMVRRRFYADSVRNVLKLKKPLQGMIQSALRPAETAVGEDEALVCAFIKAKGRHGDLDAIQEMLQTYWGIIVRREQTDEGQMIHRIGGGHTNIPATSCTAPTEALLEAVVHGYANAGEAQLAGDLLRYIANRYAIPIPGHVWSDLLCYARIHRARPANREWLMVGMPHKITHKDYIFEIWQTATQPPHNFNPGIEDYLELLKEQVGREKMIMFRDWNLELIRQVKILYVGLTKELQEAWADLVHATRQGVPNHAAYRRYRLLQSRKHYAWHSFHYIARRALKHVTPFRLRDPPAFEIIPNLILELHEFLPSVVQYRIPTGIVRLKLGVFQEWQDEHPVPDFPMAQPSADHLGEAAPEDAVEEEYADDWDDEENLVADTEQTDEENVQDDDAFEDALNDALEETIKDEPGDVFQDDEFKEDGNVTDGQDFVESYADGTLRIKTARGHRPHEQRVEQPAVGRRPRPVAPAGEVSLYSLAQEGKVFKGYENEPAFAARQQIIVTRSARPTPVNLHARQSTQSTLEQLVRMRR